MEKVRFAIVGCGEIAVQTAQGMAEAPHVEIALTMDIELALAQDLAQRHAGRATSDFEAVLADPAIDAVYIAIPHDLHAPLAIAAAQAGKHVLLEKPIATNVADAKRIIAACAENQVTLGIAFVGQVDADCRRLRQLIAEGLIGKVVGIRYAALADKPAYYWHGGYTRRVHTDWRISKARSGGGIVIMNLIHDFNTIRFITGLEAVRVFAEYGTFATPVEVEDLAFATLRYDNGAIGSVEAGSAIRGGSMGAEGDRIFGTHGQIIIGRHPRVYSLEGGQGIAANEWVPIAAEQPSARYSIAEGYATALLEGRQPPVTGEDGLKALEIVEGIYRSGETGRPVTLPL